MRQRSPIRTLLRQVRVWQKAAIAQISPNANDASAFRTARHLILILFVLRIKEQQDNLLPRSSSDLANGCASESLMQLQQGTQTGVRLMQLWRSIQPQLTRLPVALELPDLPLPDRLLRSIIRRLYDIGSSAICFEAGLLGQIYETLLIDAAPLPNSPPRSSRRKSQGIYYTPDAIVQFMVQQTLDRLLGNSPPAISDLPRLLDPACGGGAFLLETYQALLDWQLQQLVMHYPDGHDWLTGGNTGDWQLTWAARQQILQHCIYGVDLDPEAVTIAQISLGLKLLQGGIPLNAKLPDLNANVRVGNALIGESAIEAAIPDRESHWFDWQRAFPAVMNSGGFDGVVGNPPYLDSEQMTLSCPTWRTYCAKHYQTAIGNWDLFCVFVEKALLLCRSGGMVSLIVPNKLASAPYGAQARLLLMQHNLLLIRDYARVPVFAASVYPLMYLVQKAESQAILPDRTPVRYEVMESLTQVERSGWLNQNPQNPAACWQFTQSPLHAQLTQRLQQLPALGTIAQVCGAATVAEAYALKPWLQECDQPAPEDFRFVNSGTIDRYMTRWGKKPTRYLGQIYQHPILSGDRLQHLITRRQQQACQPKIIVAGLSQRLECVLDSAGRLLAGKSTCLVDGIPDEIDWRYLLALLNSRLLTVYLRDSSGGNQLQSGYLRIGTAQLKSLPIAFPNLAQAIDRILYAEIIDLVQSSIIDRLPILFETRHRLEQSSFTDWYSDIDRQIDQRVFHFYRLTDEEAAAIAHTSSQQEQ